jgi:hypothetical protein
MGAVPFLTEDGGAELDLIPAQVAPFGRSQPVPEGDQDHGGVPVPVPVRFGGLDQRLYFGRRQVLSGAELGVGASFRSNCSIYLSWGHELQIRFRHEKRPSRNLRLFVFWLIYEQPQSRHEVGESNCRTHKKVVRTF